MLWIALIIIFGIILIGAIYSSIKYRKGYGKQIGGDEHISFFSPANKKAGKRGERIANNKLVHLLKKDEFLLANLLIPLKNGHKAEIDSIIISHKGIFCIETKKWVGHIYGNDEDEYWYQEYDDPYKKDRQHINPVKQNENHCLIIDRILNHRFSIYNIVIFVSLQDGRGVSSKHAYTIRDFAYLLESLPEDKLSIDDINAVCEKLVKFVATPEELEEYRDERENA